jgi:serine-type D-Ala-D-Ala carboxypeptidase/endopeptidase
MISMQKNLIIFILIASFSQIITAQTDDELRKIFRDHIEMENAGSSVVMVEVSEKGTRYISYGKLNKDASSSNADEKTIYEIGSITKVFTGILLAEAIRLGEVKLDDPISKHLPKSVKTPTFNNKEITLLDLATHTSGLPRLPDNFAPKDALNPYVDYTSQNLYDFLAKYKLTREISTKYDYSNLGVGLLGHILSLKAKMTFEQLITTRILKPLKMTDTSIDFPTAKNMRHAQGLDENNDAASNWTFDALAGAGALRTTATDMAKFISANLELTTTPLSTSFTEVRKVLRQGQSAKVKIGLCWNNVDLFGTETFWHGGGTGGFTSYLAIAPSKNKGVFLVRNWGGANGAAVLESVAFNSIESKFPITKANPPKVETSLSEEILEKYVGEYQIAPTFSIAVTREGKQLFAQATGQGKFELFGEKEDEFFAKVTAISISFKKDESGKISELIIHQGGRKTPAKKVK